MSDLHALTGFMAALNNADADGRILVNSQAGTLKFVLLNAAAHFAKVRQNVHTIHVQCVEIAKIEKYGMKRAVLCCVAWQWRRPVITITDICQKHQCVTVLDNANTANSSCTDYSQGADLTLHIYCPE